LACGPLDYGYYIRTFYEKLFDFDDHAHKGATCQMQHYNNILPVGTVIKSQNVKHDSVKYA